jgi:hypothetical protein
MVTPRVTELPRNAQTGSSSQRALVIASLLTFKGGASKPAHGKRA